MADRARNLLSEQDIRAEIEPLRVRGAGPGAGIFLVAAYENVRAGFSALGEKGKPSERVSEEAIARFSRFNATQAAVDRHLADQLLLPMAVADGRSEMTVEAVTGHLLTNAEVIRTLCGTDISIQGAEGAEGRVTVSGVSGS
jgi:RNA 3'-terminal phosphate cyclase (ATP)